MEKELNRSPSRAQLAALIICKYSRMAPRFAHVQTQIHQLYAACALERYRLAHKSYPEKLEALIPDYLDRIPNDVCAADPLRYRRQRGGVYELRSAGWDKDDDEGRHASERDGKSHFEKRKGDWVWPL